MSRSTFSFLNPSRSVVAALCAVLLAACSGGGDTPAPPTPVDPLALFTQQKLDWQACDISLFGDGENPIARLGKRVTCASMRAPLDYNNPSLGELKVALMRAASGEPTQRMGAILFNPGGPGADGLLYGVNVAELMTLADPASASGKLAQAMGNRYDLIGFSPRGVGASTTLTCASRYLLQPQKNPTFDRSLVNLQNKQLNERLIAETCANNPLTPHIHTDATARDMDLVRSLIGDEKLNFIGYSYGTWLGAWYASLFPERVGRMLLDSSMNVAGSFDDAKLLQEMGKQRVMDEILFPYAARNNKLFNLGGDAGQIRANLLALSAPLKSGTMDLINFTNSRDFDANPLSITAALGLQAIGKSIAVADQNSIDAAIQTYTFTPGAGNAVAASLATKLNAGLFKAPERLPVVLKPEDATYESVICNDLATTGDELYWVSLGNEYAARYPLVGGAAANICLYWGAPYGHRPPLAAATRASPILMLQSRFDALTPIEGALKTLGALPNARMIVVESDYWHGLYPYGTTCVDSQVTNYFVNGTLPARTSSCPGKPLPADAAPVATPKASVKTTTDLKNDTKTDTYADPAKANEIMQRIHKRLRDAAREF